MPPKQPRGILITRPQGQEITRITKSVFEKFLAAKKGKKCPQRYSLSIYKKTKDSPKETKKKSYPTDLNDDQWELVKDLIPAAGRGGRKRTVDIRAVLNGIFYINAAVYAWRMLPHDFLVWQTVYGYFRHWRITKTWQEINDKLQQWYRVSEGREATQDVLTVNQLKLLVG